MNTSGANSMGPLISSSSHYNFTISWVLSEGNSILKSTGWIDKSDQNSRALGQMRGEVLGKKLMLEGRN